VAVGRAVTVPRGTPSASTVTERLMPVSTVLPGFCPPSRRRKSLRDAAIHGYVFQLEADDPVVGFLDDLLPVCPSPQLLSTRRVGDVGYSPNTPHPRSASSAAEHQDLHKLFEDHPVGDARTVAASTFRSRRSTANCSQMDSMMYVWRRRGDALSLGSFSNSQMIERSVSILQAYKLSLLVQALSD
jgi:hypothetical protein